jgi:hypothetical protein
VNYKAKEKIMIRKVCIVPLLTILLVLIQIPAQAILFGFDCIITEDTNLGDAEIGEAQFFVDVTDAGNSQVLFTFTNTGPEASSITDVYFDNGSLLGIASIDNSDPGVSFSQDANPPDVPGGNSIDPPFNVTEGFLADSDSPPPKKGVNPGENLGILFDLQPGKTFGDIFVEINVMNPALLRIGIHVQDFDSGGSESFINNTTGGGVTVPPIPEPTTIVLMSCGLIGLLGVAVRKRMKKK